MMREKLRGMKREEILKKVFELGFNNEKRYKGCSQSALVAVQDVFGLQNPEVFKSATSLAGGVGDSTLGQCGALSGGVMILSYLYGRDKNDFDHRDLKSYYEACELVKKLINKFNEEYGSIMCKDIQTKIFGRSYNLWDSEDLEAFEKAGAHTDKCTTVVGKAARWVAEIILDKEKIGKQV
ncbi:hypothetical protein ES704_03426 [subsurface metagenome]|jgi:C_GCAxxG_C_C family probable redox protein